MTVRMPRLGVTKHKTMSECDREAVSCARLYIIMIELSRRVASNKGI